MKKIKIKMVECFSGVSMTFRGVENTDCFEPECVATCENNIDAIVARAAIHDGLTPELIENYPDYPSRQEMIDTLVKKNIGYDFMKDKPYNWQKYLNSADTKNFLKKVWLADKLSKNLGDITKVEMFPKCGLLTWSFPCVTEDSLIFTKDGYKQMKDIKVGDIVLTKSNTWHPIVKKFDNGIHETCYIDGYGLHKIHCTLNHEFYVREKYMTHPIKADGRSTNVRAFKEPKFKAAKDLTRNDFFGIPVIKDEKPFYTDDLDFWYLIGYYVGDGYLSVTGYDIRLCCNKIKLQRIQQHLDQNKWGYSVNDQTLSCYKLRFANKEIYEFIKNTIGTGCENKRIPYEIIALPKLQLEAFLQGYIDSDGNIHKNGKNDFIRISSINEQVMYSTMLIINKLYHRPVSIFQEKPRTKDHYIEGRKINNNYYPYEIKFKKSTDKQDKAFYENGYIWYPFYKLTMSEPKNVYNIEVEEDHSYILQGCISKNCTDLSVSGKQRGMNVGETRSGLAWEVLRILRNMDERPNFLLMENVDALVSKKFLPSYETLNEEFKKLGYDCKWQVINGKFCGVPQNRKRTFAVYWLRDKIDLSSFEFPKPFWDGTTLQDVLEDEVDEKYYITSDKARQLIEQLVVDGKVTEEDFNAKKKE